MLVIFGILVILAAVILGLIVLIQNPKGGGLSGTFGGIGNQFMGVKQTTDVLERGTWIFAAVIAALCLFSVFFIPKTATSTSTGASDAKNATLPSSNPTAPANTVPLNPTPVQPVPNK